MLKLNLSKVKKGGKLTDCFESVSEEIFEEAAEKWQVVQKRMVDLLFDTLAGQAKGEKDRESLSMAHVMDLFFQEFDTQELQDVALMQLLVGEIDDKIESISHEILKETMSSEMMEFFEMMKKAAEEMDGSEEESDESPLD